MRAVPPPPRPPAPPRQARRRGFFLAVGACLIGIAILCGLGAWQLQRLAWKEALIGQIDERIHSEPDALAEIEQIWDSTKDVEYRPVEVSGRFQPGADRFFFTTFNGDSGWNVYTPLELADGRRLLVNRGFVPYDLKDPARRNPLPEGDVEFAGLARNPLPEKPDSWLPDNDPKQNSFFWKSLPEMAEGLPPGGELLPFFVDEGPTPKAAGWPVGGTTIVEVPNNHLQYAFTWFGLALVLAVMLGAFLRKSARPGTGMTAVPRAGSRAKG
jgi:surfeit locus 1 family protein